ncbi:MAG TPA: alpha-N-arabinofuranosidase, partial [Acidobacteriaceae bacterium]|nr:alpha-N-arabinofuranosidase [Acidobacteriaceae bacterium]
FSDRGTGITFQPATAFAHMSNEPVQALGTGVTLDHTLSSNHPIDDVVRDATVTTAGYQGKPEPNQWFGGPELATNAPFFEMRVTRREGSMVLRDAAGLVVDSLNYGLLADPWAGEGYQGVSGFEREGCYVTAPGAASGFGPFAAAAAASNTSAGRYPDGADSDSNCTDFVTSPATSLSGGSKSGATNLKVTAVEGFDPGQTIQIDTGANLETAVIAAVGTAGGTTVGTATEVGAKAIQVASTRGFTPGESISIDSGGNYETAVIASVTRFPTAELVLTAPLTVAHAAGAEVSGTGITLTAPLSREHAGGAQVVGSLSTPGAPNHYYRKLR